MHVVVDVLVALAERPQVRPPSSETWKMTSGT